jgi:BirA family transcriptional regulator, biotin operon repressor / biotin---[acetyl-CoA-carboxylase] ligase
MFTAMAADSANPGSEWAGIEGITEIVGTRFRDVRWVAETGSTNSDLLALARDGAPEGTVLVADHQSEGRGRQGRSWVAPPGSSLLVSVLLRPPAPLAGATTMAASVALVDAVEEVAGGAGPGEVQGWVPHLKWPNDVVVRGSGRHAEERKLAGILAESDWPAGSTIAAGWREPAAHERAAVVVGAGVNVNWPEPGAPGTGELPPDVAERATALNWLTGRQHGRAELLHAYLRGLEQLYGRMLEERSPQAILAAWRERSATLGRVVRVDLGADEVEGTAIDITDEGHLVVDAASGSGREGGRRTFAVGDVVHLR